MVSVRICEGGSSEKREEKVTHQLATTTDFSRLKTFTSPSPSPSSPFPTPATLYRTSTANRCLTLIGPPSVPSSVVGLTCSSVGTRQMRE